MTIEYVKIDYMICDYMWCVDFDILTFWKYYLKWLSKGITLNYVNMDYITFYVFMLYILYDLLGLPMLAFSVQGVEPWKSLGETSSKPLWTQFNQGESLEDSKALLWKYFAL